MNEIDRQTIFSGVLRVLMKDRGLTTNELAEKLGSTYSAVHNYTTGGSFPVVKKLCELADFFEVTPDQLLGYRKLTEKELPPPPPPKPKKLDNTECAAAFRRILIENEKTLADYKEISGKLNEAIHRNTRI